jgi:hypothetical protein
MRVLGAGDRPRGLELAITLAEEEAREGNAGAALQWLSVAEALEGELPAEYERKRLEWTLGSEYLDRPAVR